MSLTCRQLAVTTIYHQCPFKSVLVTILFLLLRHPSSQILSVLVIQDFYSICDACSSFALRREQSRLVFEGQLQPLRPHLSRMRLSYMLSCQHLLLRQIKNRLQRGTRDNRIASASLQPPQNRIAGLPLTLAVQYQYRKYPIRRPVSESRPQHKQLLAHT